MWKSISKARLFGISLERLRRKFMLNANTGQQTGGLQFFNAYFPVASKNAQINHR
jgi:hypothetical protein